MKLGIDFGTSFSLGATIHLGTKEILLPGGTYGIPSVFYYDDWDGVLIGEDAEDAGQGDQAKNLRREIKLELNSTFVADGKRFSAKEIVGYILSYVKEVSLQTAQEKMIDERLEGVVISVPAAFTSNEKEFIRAAAEIPTSRGGPGLKVLGFIKEPVAAALAYFDTPLNDDTKILVYDLGGGTCDVAIVKADSRAEEKYTVVDSDMLRIGGRNWDEKLQAYITAELEKQSGISVYGKPAYTEKIKRAAVKAKEDFSTKRGTSYRDKVRAKIEINGRNYSVEITKQLFNELTLELLKKTITMTRALIDKNGDKIDKLICVGGSSNMPQVIEGLKNAFKGMDIRVYEPEKAVALGAAIYAQFCKEHGAGSRILSDIAPYSYGIRCYEDYDKNPDKEVVLNLILKGDKLPKQSHRYFKTVKDGQTYLTFKVFESALTKKNCELYEVGDYVMEVELPLPHRPPKNTNVDVTMTLNADGLIEVSADDSKGHLIRGDKHLNF